MPSQTRYSAPNGGGSGSYNKTNGINPAQQAAANAQAIVGSTGISNAQSLQDYTQRSSQLGNNVNKIALIGRSGLNSVNDALGRGSSQTANIMSQVIFEATPDMQESGRTILIDIGDIRAAASIVFYMGSPSRSFSLDAKFVSRTTDEAAQNMAYINTLKAWRMPMIKKGTTAAAGQAIPETLRLYAYGNVVRGIPCMIESLSISYPSDVDYIQTTLKPTTGINSPTASKNTPTGTGSNIWVPIIQNVSIGLKEVRSYDDLSAFDYDSYKAGTLPQW